MIPQDHSLKAHEWRLLFSCVKYRTVYQGKPDNLLRCDFRGRILKSGGRVNSVI